MGSIREVLRGNLLVFTVGDVLRQLSMFITFPFLSLYVQALGGGVVEIGLVNGLRPLSSFFLYPVAGYVSDRFSRVRVVWVMGVVSGVLWLLFAYAPDWRWLAVGNLLMGLMAFYFPAANSLMAESIPRGRRGLGYGVWQAVPMAVGVVAPLAGGALIGAWGVERAMRFLFRLTCVVNLGIAAMNRAFLRDEGGGKAGGVGGGLVGVLVESYRASLEVLRGLPRGLRGFAFMLVLGFFFNSMVSGFWVVHFVGVRGFSEVEWGRVLMAASALNVALLLPAGAVVDRVGAARALTAALAASAVPVALFPFQRRLAAITLLLLWVSVANSFLMAGAPAYMAGATSPERRGTVMSALGQGMLLVNLRGGGAGGPGMGALLTLPSVLGSVVGGFFYGWRPESLWVLYGVALAVSAWVGYRSLDRGV